MTPPGSQEPSQWAPDRPRRAELAHVVALNSLAVAPFLQILTGQAEFFMARYNRPGDVFLFLALLMTALPLAYLLVGTLLGRISGKLYRGFHLLLLAVLASLSLLPGLKSWPSLLAFPAALAFGLGLVHYYRQRPSVRAWLAMLSVACLIFPALFVFRGNMPTFLFSGNRQRPESDFYLPPVPPGPSVVILLLDELPVSELMDPQGNIDAVRFPNFARLAAISTWYQNTVSFTDQTRVAVEGIPTGVMPVINTPAMLTVYPNSLFTLLGASYTSHVHEAFGMMSPKTLMKKRKPMGERMAGLGRDLPLVYLHSVLPLEIGQKLPPINRSWRDFALYSGTEKRSQEFREFLREITAPQGSAFYYYHLVMPHFPYRYLPSGKQYYGGNDSYIAGTDPAGLMWADDWAARQEYQRHSLQTGATDRLLGEMLDRLEEVGLLDSCLLVVMADHGCSFRAGVDFRRLTDQGLADILTVPLFIKAPGQKKGVLDPRAASLLDVVPTIAEHLKITLPWQTTGRSLLGAARADAKIPVIFAYEGVLKELDVNPVGWWKAPLQRKLEAVGSGSWSSLFNLGSHKSLFGRPASEFPAGPPAGQVELPFAALWADVRLTDEVLPCRIQGRLLEPSEETATLAIEVNGKIQAVTQASPATQGRFSAMIAESSLREGANQVKVYRVEGPEGSVRLDPLSEQEATVYTVDPEKGLITSSSRSYVIANGVSGDASLALEQEFYLLSGWAGDPASALPAERVLVVSQGKVIGSAEVELNLADNSKRYGPGFLRSGFLVQLPRVSIPEGQLADLEVYALSKGNSASLLPLTIEK